MFMATWAGSCFASMAAWLGCSAAGCFSNQVMKQSARVAYCFLFTLAMILAWILRDFGKPLLEKIPCLGLETLWQGVVKHFTGEPSDAFFGIQAVYRISLGNFLFFVVLSLALLDVRYRSDARAKFLMSGSAAIKFGIWLIFNALPFFLPNNVVLAYGWVARVGSVAFLLIQMLILLDFVMSVNDHFVAAGESDDRYYKWMLAATAGCYIACIVLVGLLFFWFKPAGAGACSFNVTVISLSVVLFAVFTVVSVSPLVRSGSLFPSAVIAVYVTYLAYSALQSEPHDELCNGLGHKIDAASGSTLAIGMVIMLLSVVYSAFKAGSNTQTFTLSADEAMDAALIDDEATTSAGLDGDMSGPHVQSMERSEAPARAMDEFAPVTYNYSFFHLVFALASTYIAMLLTGWGGGSEEKDLMDVGWASVYMKLATQWATALLYLWVLLAHHVLQDRSFT